MTIDWWTLGFQAVNVLILIWLLARFFWRPLANFVLQRQQAIEADLAAAAAGQEKLVRERAEIDKVRSGFAAERDAILKAAHEEAAKQAATLIEEARQAARTSLEQARAQIDEARAAAATEWQQRAARLAVDIARRLVSRLDPAIAGQAFIGTLTAEIGRLPEEVRRSALAAGSVLRATVAAPLEDALEAQCREKVSGALGGPCRLEFSTDPALVAGIELEGPHFRIANSWRADLEQLMKELGGE